MTITTNTQEDFLLTEAKKTAQNLIQSDQSTGPIKQWGNGTTLFVSTEKDDIFFTQVFKLGGKKFFIGTKK